jgi:hypothetical protein
MQMPREHILLGLEPDNLLAFLALLGFHRALDQRRPEWRARVYWAGVPLRPRLVLAQDVERRELMEAAAEGCAALAEVHSFGGRADMNFNRDEARDMLKTACMAAPGDRRRADLVSALLSDAAERDGTVRATPLCTMFGQGHQHFLERLESVPKGLPPRSLRDQLTEDELNSPEKLERALFHAWDRNDPTPSFRWDPVEDRRYALRFGNPSGDKARTVHGANRLAAIALPLLTAVPKPERGQVRLHAIGTESSQVGQVRVRWPVWSRPACLRAIRYMLAGCGIDERLPGLSLGAKYVSRRISVEKYFNFTRAVVDGD